MSKPEEEAEEEQAFNEIAKEACEFNAKLMRFERERKHLTQKAMAEEIGVAPSYIGRLERAEIKLPLFVVLEYSRVLEVPLSRFLPEEDDLPSDEDVLEAYRKLPDRLKVYAYDLIRVLGR